MRVSQLFEHVAAEHRAEVETLYTHYRTHFGTSPSGGADETLDGFASMLHARGLLTTEALQEFLTYQDLTVGTLDAQPPSDGASTTRYQLMSLLGQGAMGEVFIGRDASLRRTVAVKRASGVAARDPVLLRRFLNEAQVTAQLDHPAIVPVYGLERDEAGVPSYAMKLVRGITLTEYIEEAREQWQTRGETDAGHSLKARIETFMPVLNALAYAHRRGVIHRDLKPDNIMVGHFGQVLVMDWGIAHFATSDERAGDHTGVGAGAAPDDDGDGVGIGAGVGAVGATASSSAAAALETHPKLTIAGAVLGTPAYMSPEQAAGREIDARSDQYALGLLLQELVTLRPAMQAKTMPLMLVRAVRGEREPIASDFEPLPRELQAIIAKATARSRDDRYPSVAAMAEDLRRFLRDESVEADPDRGLRKLARWVARHRRLALAVGALGAVLGLAVILFFAWRGQVARSEEREVARARERALMMLTSEVDWQAKRMSAELHRYESLLEGIVGAASFVLRTPAPPAGDVVVYRYANGERTPKDMPAYARESAVYRQAASLHADYAAAPGVDLARAAPEIDRLAQMEGALRKALLRSIDDRSAELPFDQAERLVLDRGAPILWVYLHTESGLAVGLPGTWIYDDSPGGPGYDHRREEWYVDAVDTRGPRWSTSPDENSLGLTVNCVQTVRDPKGALIAVAGIDIRLERFTDELLDIPRLAAAGAEGILVDGRGEVLVRASQRADDVERGAYVPVVFEEAEVVAALGTRPSGYVPLSDGRLALWSRLGSAGLSYVVIGPEAALLEAADPAQ